jgi:ribokinase
MTGRVLVIGSLNVDLVVAVPVHPHPGETVLGSGLRRFPGGKGANQALAAAAAGAAVRLVGCVGADPAGAAYLAGLAERGVDVTGIRRVAGEPTGLALITVDPAGENVIVVVPGANAAVTGDDLDVGAADVVLLQLEVPLAAVEQVVRRAAAAGTRVVLNLAPYADLPVELLDLCDPVVANEHEAARLPRPPRSLVVTLGAGGARWSRDGDPVHVDAPGVEVVDTTGAGDAFAGALAAALADGADRRAALEEAVAAGAAAVTRAGAQDWTLDQAPAGG